MCYESRKRKGKQGLQRVSVYRKRDFKILGRMRAFLYGSGVSILRKRMGISIYDPRSVCIYGLEEKAVYQRAEETFELSVSGRLKRYERSCAGGVFCGKCGICLYKRYGAAL